MPNGHSAQQPYFTRVTAACAIKSCFPCCASFKSCFAPFEAFSCPLHANKLPGVPHEPACSPATECLATALAPSELLVEEQRTGVQSNTIIFSH